MPDVMFFVSLISLLATISILVVRQKNPNGNAHGVLLDTLTKTYGQKLRVEKERDELMHELETYLSQVKRLERQLARCFEHVAPRVVRDITDSWHGE